MRRGMKIHLPTSLVFTIPWVLTHSRVDHHDHTADYYGEDDDDCHFDSSPHNYKDKPHHLFSSSVSSYSSHFHLVCFRRYLVFHPIHPTCWPSNMYCVLFFVCWASREKIVQVLLTRNLKKKQKCPKKSLEIPQKSLINFLDIQVAMASIVPGRRPVSTASILVAR